MTFTVVRILLARLESKQRADFINNTAVSPRSHVPVQPRIDVALCPEPHEVGLVSGALDRLNSTQKVACLFDIYGTVFLFLLGQFGIKRSIFLFRVKNEVDFVE
jgi:hypothetical protein